MLEAKHKAQSYIGRWFRILLILSFLLAAIPAPLNVAAQEGTEPEPLIAAGRKIFLPQVRNGNTANSELPLMTGIYPVGWPGSNTVANEMRPLDNWLTGVTGGRSTSIFGTFMTLDLTDANAKSNVEDPLTDVWNAGYTPFVNLPALPGDTAAVVASGQYDQMITTWAKSFKNYANNGTRFAYIAPLQEMNGEWVAYGKDPQNYILAYRKFQTIFSNVGVPRKSVKWVFAPNGWTKPGLPLFEEYYPGDSHVDVVAISAYNFGYCHGGVWQEPATVYNHPNITDGFYLERLRVMAPSKPIFVAQTATSSYRNQGGSASPAEKERWLRDAYKYLANQPAVRAVIYFNLTKECDWAIFNSSVKNAGYKTGVTSNGYKYISPSSLMNTDHTVR